MQQSHPFLAFWMQNAVIWPLIRVPPRGAEVLRRSVSHCSVLFRTDRQPIPEGLAEVTGGPELAQMLAGTELSALSGYDCVEGLKAQSRQVHHERAPVNGHHG